MRKNDSVLVAAALGALIFVMASFFPCTASGADKTTAALPRWLEGYDIKPGFIPRNADNIGTIKSLTGRIVIVHQETDDAFFGEIGDPVFVKDTIATLENSVCRIQFSTGDSATLSADSILALEEYLDARAAKKKSAFLEMKAGRVFFYVLRVLGYRDIDFKVKTPASVAAVRGTKFGLHVYQNEASRAGGDAWHTDCYCEDGLIEIDGLQVHRGELYQSGTREVHPASPAYRDRFHAALNLPLPPAVPISCGSQAIAAKENMRVEIVNMSAGQTDDIQERRQVELLEGQDANPGSDSSHPSESPSVESPPSQPESPSVESPPSQPESPSVESPPAQPESPSVESPPAQPESPSVESPPAQPESPSVESPPAQPESPSVESPPSQPESPSVDDKSGNAKDDDNSSGNPHVDGKSGNPHVDGKSGNPHG